VVHAFALGLRGGYTQQDLKKAWRSEASRWHPDQLMNKPPHLIKQAEEELKHINLAYEKLKKKFGQS
jgi:DnaJ-class molecular chaperone